MDNSLIKPMNNKLIQSKILSPALVFFFSFIIYFFTASQDIDFTDSGELAAVATTLGIAHPTGYPLFTLLSHLWSKIPLPFSNIHSLNLFASFSTALSAVMFSQIMLLLFNFSKVPTEPKKSQIKNIPRNYFSLLMTVSAGLFYAFASLIWQQAVIFEVYSLQLLLINLTIFFLLKAFLELRHTKYYFFSALLLGLGFSNHLTSVLLVPAFLFLFLFHSGKFELDRKKIITAFLILIPFFIGLSLYIYLPLRSASAPLFDWGGVSRGLDKFLYHVQGKQYQVWMFAGGNTISENFSKFIAILPSQFAMGIGLIPLIWGIIKLWKANKLILLFLALLVFSCLFYTLNYSIHDIETYFATAFIALLILSCFGFYHLALKIGKFYPAIIILPVMSLILNYSSNDKSYYFPVREYTKNLAKHLEPNAIIISAQWDYWCSAFWYMQQVEGFRPDIVLLEKELLRRTWYPKQFQRWYPDIYKSCQNEFNIFLNELEPFESGANYNQIRLQNSFVSAINCIIDKNWGRRPIYLTADILHTDPDIGKSYEFIPDGFAFRLEKSKEIYQIDVENYDLNMFFNSLQNPKNHLESGILTMVALHFVNMGKYALTTNQMDKAKLAFQKVLKIDPTNQVALQSLDYLNSQNVK